ncbi:hydroxymethylglutaryl-CoA lyase [Mycobacterium marseillense]|uniref:hydroxymethylglutaryl-CoA lyase n=1 Tax=Mycobacterium marseillense TaxID=701042 RepID=UPI001F4F6543|nr:hydroxymethylglutaryl-CoA lyase [Mycobacterium marseillense]
MPVAGLPERVTIYEVGPRDGLQNEKGVIPTDVKVEFIERLGAAGLRTIEAAGFVHPGRVPQLADAERVIEGLNLDAGQRYPVLVPTLSGLDRAFSRGVRDIAVFGSATETFSQRNLGRSIDESLAMFAPVVTRAREAGASVRGYVSMCCGDPWEGTTPIAKVVDVATRMMDLGCDQLALGDTIGVGTPGHIKALVEALVGAGIAVGSIAVHFHDTYGQALANVLAALQSGVSTIDSSAGGLGGCPFADSSSGNLATEDLVWMLDGLGIDTGVDVNQLVSISMWMSEHLGKPCVSRTVQALAGSAPQVHADRETATVAG